MKNPESNPLWKADLEERNLKAANQVRASGNSGTPRKQGKNGDKTKDLPAGSSRLFDDSNYPTKGRESGILMSFWGCAFYSLFLLGICCNTFALFSISDPFGAAEWYQKIKFFHDLTTLQGVDLALFTGSIAVSGAFIFRIMSLTWNAGRNVGVFLALLPAAVLGWLPLSQMLLGCLNSVVNSLRHINLTGHFDPSRVIGTIEIAAVFSILVGVCVLVRSFAFPRNFLRYFEDGVLISANSLSRFIGEKAVPWSQFEAVQIIQSEKDLSAGRDPVLKLVYDHGKTMSFKWADLRSTCDPGELLNAIRTYATCPVIGQVLAVADKDSHHETDNYTELWLKYFTDSAKRERKGQLEPGAVMCQGRYEVVGGIGGGGQGTAYLAIRADSSDGQNLVLKEYIFPMHRGEALFLQSLQKLEHEAEILSRISHPGIVKLQDLFIQDHRGYLVMEYVEGRHLKDLVASQGPQPEHAVVSLSLQICEMLHYLHTLTPPVVHRDLTPDNLILQEDGLLKLVDFNVAHQLESEATATVVGKHSYIPPEQFRGKPTQASDIYAFGGTMHYLLTGLEPEPLTTSRPASLNQSISPGLDAIVAKATALDAAKRFASVKELKDALESL